MISNERSSLTAFRASGTLCKTSVFTIEVRAAGRNIHHKKSWLLTVHLIIHHDNMTDKTYHSLGNQWTQEVRT